jgi:peptidoglycan/xylan/chitin deacetylase (PgdA/CDA1 family)
VSDVVALGYHGVSDAWPSPMAVTTTQLREQVGRLIDRGYRPVTVADAVRARGRERLLVITFDDALASVHRLGLPILADLGAVATVYAPTAPILAGEPMAWPEVSAHFDGPHAGELDGMTVAQLGELLGRGWEVGSHTRTHPWLPRLDDAELADELGRSRAELRDALGIACDGLAYPFGAHDDRVVAAAGRAGYTSAVTLPRRTPRWAPQDAGDGHLRLARIGVYRADGRVRFAAKVARPSRRVRETAVADVLSRLRG